MLRGRLWIYSNGRGCTTRNPIERRKHGVGRRCYDVFMRTPSRLTCFNLGHAAG
jgi:hypothetical protein